MKIPITISFLNQRSRGVWPNHNQPSGPSGQAANGQRPGSNGGNNETLTARLSI